MSTIELRIFEVQPELDLPHRVVASTADLDHVGWMWELHVLEQRVTELLRGSGEAVYTFEVRENPRLLAVVVSVWGSEAVVTATARCAAAVLSDFGHVVNVEGALAEVTREFTGEFVRSDVSRGDLEAVRAAG